MSAASVTTMAFLPLVSASRRSRGFQPRNSWAVAYDAGEHDGGDVVVGDQAPADLVVRAGDELQDVTGDAGPPALVGEQPGGLAGLRAAA